jgi:hypothetical protein
MSQLFTIENDRIVINKLALTELVGDVTHSGNLTITDTLTVETLNVKNLKTNGNSFSQTGNWVSNTEADINGKGFSWTWGEGSVNLQYRDGGRIWANGDIDLDTKKTYKIDNVSVLSAGALGPTIVKSNLKQVGQLNNLTVLGNTSIGQFAFFDSGLGRIGVNTETPNGAIGIVENDIEIVIGSSRIGSATIGTYTNHDLNIITDNTPRIILKNSGEITVNSDVKINGTLHVETIVSDTRVDRTSPLEFKATRDTAIYGRGLIWTGTGPTRQLVMMANPDRLWSSESIDVSVGQGYYVNGQVVLTDTGLGDTVVNSNLSKLGNLESLTVIGASKFIGNIDGERSTATFKNAIFNNGVNQLNITSIGLNASSNIVVSLATQDEVFYADSNEIVLGNKSSARRPVKVNGPMSIGVNNPDPDVDFTVKGNVSIANRKFITGLQAPTQGTFSKGDICWNNDPQGDNYIGWVCVVEGTPGTWLPFGAIVRQ